MKHVYSTIVAAAALSLAAGCANMTETQRDTAKGAGIGAAAGGVLGAIVRDDNRGRGAATGAAIGAAAGAIAGNIWSNRMQEQRRVMEEATRGTGVDVSRTANNELKLDIPADASFDVGSAAIKPTMAPVLDRFAATLREHPGTTVRIIGHTDSTGSDAVNEPLSVNRAASARAYLVARGVSQNRIQIDGRGSRQPVASNETADGRARNRRIEVYVAEPSPQ